MGLSLAGSETVPPGCITYCKFSADQEKCLLSCSVFFFFLPLFYFTYNLTQAQMVFVRGNWQPLEAVFHPPEWEISKRLSMLKENITFDLFK